MRYQVPGVGNRVSNMPWRLIPGVPQMIMGLPAGERDALLQAVAQRTEALVGDDSAVKIGVATPRELYDFQLTGQTGSAAACVVAGAGLTPAMTETICRPMEVDAPSKMKMEKKEKMPMTMCSVVISMPAASIPDRRRPKLCVIQFFSRHGTSLKSLNIKVPFILKTC